MSSEVDRFTLKGATLFLVWAGKEFRATRDVDLLGPGEGDHVAVRASVTAICAIADPADGLRFDPETIRIDDIRDEQDYGGVRVKLVARLGTARIPLQVDIGFGDVIYPGRQEADYPTLLDHAAPHLWTYPRETTIAEKFEAMVRLGAANSRMKDFWDPRSRRSSMFEESHPHFVGEGCQSERWLRWRCSGPSIRMRSEARGGRRFGESQESG